MTTLRTAVIGDVGDSRLVTLQGVNTLANAASVEAHVWRTNVDPVTLDAAVEGDGSDCQIRVELGDETGWLATEAATGAAYKVEYQVTFNDGDIITWPETPDLLPVRAQGDPA